MPTLKPYSTYKPAGVPWLQQVPEHWELLRTKNFLREVNVRSKTGKEDLLSVSQYTGITKRKDSLRGGSGLVTTAKTLVGYKLVEPGDLVMNIMLAWRGSQAVSPIAGITSPAYSVFRVTSDQVVPQYLHYIYRTELYNGLFKTVSTGVMDSRLRLYPEVFFRLPTLLPPPDEQHLIVRYLHALDAKVKRYIRAKRTLIARLQEQKQAIIRRAVTRGLNPNVKLKPSGVEWLGEVPEHWRMTRVKSEFKNLDRVRVPLSADVRGKMSQRIFDYYGASGVIDKVEDYLFDDQLILIAEDGANLVLRNLRLVLIAQGKFWVNNHAHILKPMRGNIHYWAELLETLSYKPWITGAAQPKLTGDRLMGIALAAPDYAEQNEIVDYYMKATEPLTRTIEHEQRAVNHMLEYHTRLIADVVTGAVDVQEAAKAMKEEAPVAMEEELEIETEVEEEHGTE
jgi:type I restriction enzyme S subunit